MTVATGQGILSYMFPITPRLLYAGSVVGDERVITIHNGSYAFGGTGSAAVTADADAASCVCFDEAGLRVGRTGEPGEDSEQVMATTTSTTTTTTRHGGLMQAAATAEESAGVSQHSCVVPFDGACVILPAATSTAATVHAHVPAAMAAAVEKKKIAVYYSGWQLVGQRSDQPTPGDIRNETRLKEGT